jgi:hypothetical protein
MNARKKVLREVLAMEMNEDDIYIIPHNYSDNGKILGFIEKQSLYIASAWFVPITFLNFKFLSCFVEIKIFIEILLIVPPTLFFLVGVGGDTLFDFLRYIFRFYKKGKVYFFGK